MSDPVLERNIELLLQRAYEPALPSDAFRRRLEQAVVGAVEPRVERRGLPWGVLALAAALVMLAVGIRFNAALRHPQSVEEALAKGYLVVRDLNGAQDERLFSMNQRAKIDADDESLHVEVLIPDKYLSDRSFSIGDHCWIEYSPNLRVEVRGGEPLRIRVTQGVAVVRKKVPEPVYIVGGLRGDDVELGQGEVTVGPWGCSEVRDSWFVREPRPDPDVADGPGREALPGDDPEPTEESQPEGAIVRGVVADAATGRPVPRFRVFALEHRGLGDYVQPTFASFDDAAGRFELTGLDPGNYTLFVDAPGYAVRRLERRALGVGELELEVRLERGFPVRGWVRDADGEPIAGARVLSEHDVPSEILPIDLDALPIDVPSAVVTGNDGYFEIPALETGDHVLRATAPGFGPAWSERLELASGVVADELAFELRPGSRVSGSVVRADGSPWVGARVIAMSVDFEGRRTCQAFGMATVDESGRYAIDDLPSGYSGVVLLDENEDLVRVEQLALGKRDDKTLDFDFAEGSGTLLRGVVRDAAGEPAGGRSVILVREDTARSMIDTEWKVSNTDADGAYEFRELEPGAWYLFVGSGMEFTYLDEEVVELAAGAELERDVRLGAARITGVVRDELGGAGVSSAIVLIRTDPITGDDWMVGKVLSDAEGRYELEDLLPGEYRVDAYPIDRGWGQESSAVVTLTDAAPSAEVDFDVRLGGTVLVRVRDEAGAPVSGAALALRPASGGAAYFLSNAMTDDRGTLEFPGIRPGTWVLRVEHADYETARRELHVLAETEDTLEITLTRADG